MEVMRATDVVVTLSEKSPSSLHLQGELVVFSTPFQVELKLNAKFPEQEWRKRYDIKVQVEGVDLPLENDEYLLFYHLIKKAFTVILRTRITVGPDDERTIEFVDARHTVFGSFGCDILTREKFGCQHIVRTTPNSAHKPN